jgi:ribonuclease HI
LFANRQVSTRIIKWGAELSEYIVDFEKRSAIKLQVLADFVMDWTSPTQNLDEKISEPWIVQCDGAWCYKGVGISAVVTSPVGIVIRYAARLIFANNEHSTNNTTEYEALLLTLRKMKALGQQTFIIRTDSKVIQEHVEKESEARNPVLMKYLEKLEKWKDTSKVTQSGISQKMTTMRQTSWRKQQPEIKNCPLMCSSKSSENHPSRIRGRKS